MTSGEDATVPRHTTAPAASTTQIDVNSSDTSKPTYCSMAFPFPGLILSATIAEL